MTTSFEGSEIFHASPEKILSLINNFELYKEFLPGCIESSRLHVMKMVGKRATSFFVNE